VIRHNTLLLGALLMGLLLVLSACGGDDDDTGATATVAPTTAVAPPTPVVTAAPTPVPTETAVPTITPAPVPVTRVDIRFFAFNPGDVEIKVGESVKWVVHDDGAIHTVTSDTGAFDSGELSAAPGTAYQVPFEFAGVYPYHCQIHSDMIGSVVVIEG